ALKLLIDEADDITLADFKERIGGEQLDETSRGLGYVTADGEEGLRLENDYHVRFQIHRESGVPFMVHSGIEIVYATPEQIDALEERGQELLDELMTLDDDDQDAFEP
ncbi:hypothetical protein, partial [Parvibaculum sp.]